MKNSDFFDSLSSDYDEMINFENSLKIKTESLKNFISSKYKYALDLGCGTAADSIILSKLGLMVDAVDQSKGMLDKAKINSERFNSKINFIQSDLTDFTIRNKNYDLIVSLGNTLANLNKIELRALLKKLYGYLILNGKMLIQIINYAKLPKSGKYILSELENDLVSITRKYNINSNDIDFIIDKIDKENDQQSHIVTKLYPHSENDFKKLAEENGFKLESFGSLTKEPYINDKSQNLVILLTK